MQWIRELRGHFKPPPAQKGGFPTPRHPNCCILPPSCCLLELGPQGAPRSLGTPCAGASVDPAPPSASPGMAHGVRGWRWRLVGHFMAAPRSAQDLCNGPKRSWTVGKVCLRYRGSFVRPHQLVFRRSLQRL
jgi:hypothetical protein